MGKLIRILVIYCALMITFIGVNTTISTRTILDKLNKSTSQIEEYQKQLEKITTKQQTGQVGDEMNEQVLSSGNKLKAEIASSSQVLGTTEEPKEATKTQLGFVTINDKKWENVSIYESKSYSSKVLAKAEFGKPYLYMKKEEGWYQIALPSNGANGWVSSRFFKETSNASQ